MEPTGRFVVLDLSSGDGFSGHRRPIQPLSALRQRVSPTGAARANLSRERPALADGRDVAAAGRTSRELEKAGPRLNWSRLSEMSPKDTHNNTQQDESDKTPKYPSPRLMTAAVDGRFF